MNKNKYYTFEDNHHKLLQNEVKLKNIGTIFDDITGGTFCNWVTKKGLQPML